VSVAHGYTEPVRGLRLASASQSPPRAAMSDATEVHRVRVLLRGLIDAIACQIALLCEPDRTGDPWVVASFGMDASAEIEAAGWTGGQRRGGRGRGASFGGRALNARVRDRRAFSGPLRRSAHR
jgi:hypothetical protein